MQSCAKHIFASVRTLGRASRKELAILEAKGRLLQLLVLAHENETGIDLDHKASIEVLAKNTFAN